MTKEQDKYIDNIGDYLTENFQKIKGFDFKWTSLITNSPLLFEDIDYLRVRDFVNNTVTPEEVAAYKRGELRELYATFENMLVCNLKNYDRIMSYCTMVFLHYVKIDGVNYDNGLDKVPYILSMTPTQIWCAAMTSIMSTEWEVNYAWSPSTTTRVASPGKGEKSVLEMSWKKIYASNSLFAKFNEYNALRCGTSGFRETWINDKTSNRKLSIVCQKFTKASSAISDQQLDTIYDYIKGIEDVNGRLYVILDRCLSKMFAGDRSQYAIYIYTNEFYIHTSKFSIRTTKSKNGTISKDYLANSYECFAAEEYLLPSVKTQIEWAQYRVPTKHFYDKTILKNLLSGLLREGFRDTICVKRMNEYGTTSKATFKGIFGNVILTEELIFDNRTIKTYTKTYSKSNMAEYLIEKGYYIFGSESDVHKMITETDTLSRQSIIDHYAKYCVPVMQHMYDVIRLHEMSKNDIIDYAVNGNLNPNRFNNANIKYTNVKNVNEKELLSKGLKQQNRALLGEKKKSYWRAVHDDEK